MGIVGTFIFFRSIFIFLCDEKTGDFLKDRSLKHKSSVSLSKGGRFSIS